MDAADETGSAFMAFFTTFGSFSIAAGILLIFLIFVMLAAERRSELGIARAIGTRRGHLVELFLFEGAVYDAAAALVGALLGAAVAYVMVIAMASALGEQGIDIEYAVQVRSLVIGYAIGMLLTLVVVALSARRVSVMTIAAAIRNLPESRVRGGRRRWLTAAAGLLVGGLLTVAGVSSSSATPLMFGDLARARQPDPRRAQRRRRGPRGVHGRRRGAGRDVDAALEGVGGRVRPAAHGLHDVDRRPA